jgi:hypothetical protein
MKRKTCAFAMGRARNASGRPVADPKLVDRFR